VGGLLADWCGRSSQRESFLHAVTAHFADVQQPRVYSAATREFSAATDVFSAATDIFSTEPELPRAVAFLLSAEPELLSTVTFEFSAEPQLWWRRRLSRRWRGKSAWRGLQLSRPALTV
jgi:hypothetical protein